MQSDRPQQELRSCCSRVNIVSPSTLHHLANSDSPFPVPSTSSSSTLTTHHSSCLFHNTINPFHRIDQTGLHNSTDSVNSRQLCRFFWTYTFYVFKNSFSLLFYCYLFLVPRGRLSWAHVRSYHVGYPGFIAPSLVAQGRTSTLSWEYTLYKNDRRACSALNSAISRAVSRTGQIIPLRIRLLTYMTRPCRGR